MQEFVLRIPSPFWGNCPGSELVCKQAGWERPGHPLPPPLGMEGGKGREGEKEGRRGMASEVERDTLPGLRLRPEQTCGGAAESTIDTVV